MEAVCASGVSGGSGYASAVRDSSFTFASTGERENRAVQARMAPVKSKVPSTTILGLREVNTIRGDIRVSFRALVIKLISFSRSRDDCDLINQKAVQTYRLILSDNSSRWEKRHLLYIFGLYCPQLGGLRIAFEH